MGLLTTHVLDATRGRPGDGIPVTLEHVAAETVVIAHGTTDADGRIREFVPDLPGAGTYRLTFDPTEYFARSGQETFYPSVSITFRVSSDDESCHVPLLLSPFAYSTYRGS
ncbi:putative 5-hydroxyisourate hydrolase (HIU hydrolase) (HIUase) [metagenome]|uniref:hydroxyisourate hydrolase n=1 Tax=metagenome TaxID=256318 RepID=A0A2P2C478_9ZZZZ